MNKQRHGLSTVIYTFKKSDIWASQSPESSISEWLSSDLLFVITSSHSVLSFQPSKTWMTVLIIKYLWLCGAKWIITDKTLKWNFCTVQYVIWWEVWFIIGLNKLLKALVFNPFSRCLWGTYHSVWWTSLEILSILAEVSHNHNNNFVERPRHPLVCDKWIWL